MYVLLTEALQIQLQLIKKRIQLQTNKTLKKNNIFHNFSPLIIECENITNIRFKNCQLVKVIDFIDNVLEL